MTPTSSTATDLRLSGISLPVGRSVFVILSLAALVFFTLGIPLYYINIAEDIDPETMAALSSLGMSPTFYAVYQTALVILLAAGGVTLASLGLLAFIPVTTFPPAPPEYLTIELEMPTGTAISRTFPEVLRVEEVLEDRQAQVERLELLVAVLLVSS